jgi:hypothetical protein
VEEKMARRDVSQGNSRDYATCDVRRRVAVIRRPTAEMMLFTDMPLEQVRKCKHNVSTLARSPEFVL